MENKVIAKISQLSSSSIGQKLNNNLHDNSNIHSQTPTDLYVFQCVCIYIYIYIYIVIHRQICFVLSELFSVARPARFLKLWSKPSWLKRQSKIQPLSHKETSACEGNLNAYVSHLFLFTYIRLTATESSIHMKSLALC